MSHFLSLLLRLVFSIFCWRMCFGTVSKALFMSIVTRIVRDGGVFWLNPSSMCWERLVSRVVVECCFLKPCWVLAIGNWWDVLRKISFSRTFDIVERRDMGL